MGGINSRTMDIEHDRGLAAVLQYLIRRLVERYLVVERFNIVLDLFALCAYICSLALMCSREIDRERG